MKVKALAVASAAFCGTVVSLIAAGAPIPRPPQRLWSLPWEYQLFDISPDGQMAAYIDWKTDGNLVVRDLASGATRDLTKKTIHDDEAEIARFSPDGKRILFNWWDSKARLDEFRTVAPDGSDMKTVYRSPKTGTTLWPAMWTADGASILLWVSHKDSNHVKKSISSAVVPAVGGTPRVIPGGGAVDAISPDGRFFAGAVRNEHDIVITSAVDGKVVSRVASTSKVGAIRFTADGLVFSSDRGGSSGIWKQPIANGKPQGEAHLVRGDLWGLPSLEDVWFDAAGRLYYQINAGDRDAYMVNIDAQTGRTRSQPLPLSKSPGADYFAPQFSLDGKYVAMTTRRGRSPEVLIRSLSGDEVRRFPLANFANSAQWVPGSQALALTLFDSTGSQNLVRLDLVSGAQSMLVKQASSPVAFAPDGRTVYYAPRARTDTVVPRIVARELASGTERAVYSAPRGSSVLASAVSPDGKTLMVALVHKLREHPYKILAVSLASGAVRDLSAMVSGADTANGGQRALGFTADQTAQLLLAPKLGDAAHTLTMWRVPLAGGGATELGPAPKGIEFNDRQTAGSWLSPDATRLVYVGGSLQTELWMIDEPAIRAQLAAHR